MPTREPDARCQGLKFVSLIPESAKLRVFCQIGALGFQMFCELVYSFYLPLDLLIKALVQ